MKTAHAILILALAFTCIATAEEPRYKRMPWHLTDLWWDLGADVPFESYSIDCTISATPPADTDLYIAPIGLGYLNRVPFYSGLQTNCDGNTSADKRLRKLGPGYIFSMWGERSPKAIRPSAGGYWQSSGHEGDFISVRRPFKWKAGKYTYRLVKMDAQKVGDKNHTWVGAFVVSHATDENIFIGSLRFPTSDLVLSRRIASFVEIYGRRKPVEAIPKLTVKFDNLRVNGEPANWKVVDVMYPQGVPDYASAKSIEGGINIDIGKPVETRKSRRERFGR